MHWDREYDDGRVWSLVVVRGGSTLLAVAGQQCSSDAESVSVSSIAQTFGPRWSIYDGSADRNGPQEVSLLDMLSTTVPLIWLRRRSLRKAYGPLLLRDQSMGES
jgi:hypothetical protein